MTIVISFFIFIFGLVVGSFLNSIIYRLSTRESFLFKRSYCPHCKQILGWQDLIPLLSFLILKGKCRYCKKPISFQYPLVELATGFLFLFIFQSTNLWLHDSIILSFLNLCLLSLVSCLLIIIFVYDLKHYIIPDRVIYPAIVIAFLYQLFRILNLGFVSDLGFRISDFMILLNPLLSAILALSFFLSIVLISRGRWMGVGDIKLAFFMGLFLGFPNILVALFSAFFIGAIIGLILIAAGLKTLKSEIPFGPFLITGTFLALFWGERLINFYQNLFFF